MANAKVISLILIPLVSAAAAYVFWPAPVQPNAAIAANAQALITGEITLPDFEGEAAIGAKAYAAKCAACHGENGVGVDGAGPPFLHKIYLASHHGDEAFYRAAQDGVTAHHWPFGNMPAVEGITRAEVGAIIAYVRALQAANGLQ